MPAGRTQQVLRISFLLFSMYALLAARLFHVQVTTADSWAHEQFSREVRSRHRIGKSLFERGQRGRIVDRQGRLLATGYECYSLVVDPHAEHQPRKGQPQLKLDERLALLSDVLSDLRVEHDRSDLLERGTDRWRHIKKADGEIVLRQRRAIILAKALLPFEKDYVQKVMCKSRITNFFFLPEVQRCYPQGELVAEIVGFVGRVNSSNTDIVSGQNGVESALDLFLAGKNGRFYCDKDGHGREFEIEENWDQQPDDGWDVELTIDLRIQQVVDDALRRVYEKFPCKAAAAVVLDSRNAEILALRSYPSSSLTALRAGDLKPGEFRCRAVTDAHEPGSTFKPFILAKAIEKGYVTWSDRFDTNHGRRVFRQGKRTRYLNDSVPHSVLDAEEVIIKSSNIGMAIIGHEKMGYDSLHVSLNELRVRQLMGIRFPGQAQPQVPRKQNTKPLDGGVSIPFGHELALSPLSVTVLFNAFANSGVCHEPTLLKSLTKADQIVASETHSHAIIRPEVADRMLTVLERTVNEGTAKVLKKLKWRAAAKTGTAQILTTPGRDFNSSMIAIAPVSAPRLTVYVGIYDLTGDVVGGGQTAGPAVAEILDEALTILRTPRDKATEDDR